MKNLSVLFIVFLFYAVEVIPQNVKIFDSTIGQTNVEQTGIVHETHAALGGALLAVGVLENTFPDYSGNFHPMGIAFDGTFYYVVGGGSHPGDVALLNASFTLVTTQSVDLDCRSVFYNPADGHVYIKGYTNNALFRLHTNPFDGGYDIVYTGIFQDAQSKVCISPDGTKMYDELDGTVRIYDFATGVVLNTITLNLQHDLTWPRGELITHTGTYLLTYAHPMVYAYDPTNGNFISACDLSLQPDANEWSMSYTNGMFFSVDAAEATWYAWTIDAGAVSVDDNDLTPIEFSLEQNYPNPFNPNTSIDFSIPRSSFVNLKVFDMLGNEVSTIVNEERPAGNYNVQFNTVNLPSGVYFYRIQAGSFIETKKMVLMK